MTQSDTEQDYADHPGVQEWDEDRLSIRNEVHYGLIDSVQSGLDDVGRLIQEIDDSIKLHGPDPAKTQARDRVIKLSESLKRTRTSLRKEAQQWSQDQLDTSFAAD